VKYFLFVLSTFVCSCLLAQDQDSLQKKIRTRHHNPYRNLKSSVFIHSGFSQILGRNYSAGFELRRFISLKEYLYMGVAYGQWTNNQDRLENDVYQDCSYYLDSKTITLRAGLGIFGHSNIVAGAHYLMDAQLKEKVPSALDPETNVFLNGNISSYTRDFIPFLGYNFKQKLWQIMFIEIGAEFWFLNTQIFQPLEGDWRVPDKVSPLLSEDYDQFIYYYATLHFKL
jgi:hypothetical protein